ncbi:hypothetical protein BUALT_Bualt15G0081900 [Buddleja alternifolia]|uniref:Uncharacterized protein n=1 Tax=Buddleja alternifolia TaxID=168488 RepID=A0AAV6WLB0_9LAMI|nr:hypothetical protein BUALT_Bualt15G0081900 [Buddleja alternifolia]
MTVSVEAFHGCECNQFVNYYLSNFDSAQNWPAPQKADATVFDGEGGAYHAWTSAKSPVMAEWRLGAGKLVLHPRGFAMPHYSDSAKIGYVIQELDQLFVVPKFFAIAQLAGDEGLEFFSVITSSRYVQY